MAVLLAHYRATVVAAVNTVLAQFAALSQGMPVARVRRLLWLLLLLYACNVIARMFWLLLPLPVAVEPVVMVPATTGAEPAKASSRRTPVDIAVLESLHLFGKAQAAGQAKEVVRPIVIEAEQTKLDLLLLGIMMSPDSSAARAIISHRNQQDLFAVGDELPGGVQVQLEQVLPGRVIIKNAGQYESLWLYEEKSKVSQPQHRLASRSSRTTAAPIEFTASEEETAKQEVMAVAPARTDAVADDVAALLEYGPSSVTANSLADIIQFTPVHANGRVLGYRIAPGRAPDLFQQFGLQKNDVITSVNGVPLDDPTRALKVYRQIQGSRSASFELMRDGESHAVEVELGNKRG